MTPLSLLKTPSKGNSTTAIAVLLLVIAIAAGFAYYFANNLMHTQPPTPGPRAGACPAPVPPGASGPSSSQEGAPAAEGELHETTEADFQRDVMDSQIPVLVDFWAPWCAPCRMLEPTLKSLAARYEGKCKIVRVNVDENRGLAEKYKISAIPTLILVKNGKVVSQTVGLRPEEDLAAAIDKALNQ